MKLKHLKQLGFKSRAILSKKGVHFLSIKLNKI